MAAAAAWFLFFAHQINTTNSQPPEPMKTTSALRLIPLFTTLAVGVTNSHAAVIVDTFGATSPGYDPIVGYAVYNFESISATFTVASSYTLDSISVALQWNSGDVQPMVFSLETDAAGVPSGVVLESFTFKSPGDSVSVFTGVSATNPLLVAGTYHLVASSTDPTFGVRGWEQTNDGHLAVLGSSADGGATWSPFTVTDVAYSVSATPVPEPSGWMLAAAGLAITAWRRRR